jgi:hypothetical protein
MPPPELRDVATPYVHYVVLDEDGNARFSWQESDSKSIVMSTPPVENTE